MPPLFRIRAILLILVLTQSVSVYALSSRRLVDSEIAVDALCEPSLWKSGSPKAQFLSLVSEVVKKKDVTHGDAWAMARELILRGQSILTSQGVSSELQVEKFGKEKVSFLRIIPDSNGAVFNRFAYGVKKTSGLDVVYSPYPLLIDGKSAAFVNNQRLHLPHFVIPYADLRVATSEAELVFALAILLHERVHVGHFGSRSRGEFGPLDGMIYSVRKGVPILEGYPDHTYSQFQYFEEIDAYPQNLYLFTKALQNMKSYEERKKLLGYMESGVNFARLIHFQTTQVLDLAGIDALEINNFYSASDEAGAQKKFGLTLGDLRLEFFFPAGTERTHRVAAEIKNRVKAVRALIADLDPLYAEYKALLQKINPEVLDEESDRVNEEALFQVAFKLKQTLTRHGFSVGELFR